MFSAGLCVRIVLRIGIGGRELVLFIPKMSSQTNLNEFGEFPVRTQRDFGLLTLKMEQQALPW